MFVAVVEILSIVHLDLMQAHFRGVQKVLLLPNYIVSIFLNIYSEHMKAYQRRITSYIYTHTQK